LIHDVAHRAAGTEKRNILKRAERRADDEFKPGGADGNDPSDGLSTVEHDDGLATADGLEVLAQVGLELSGAYGRHDYVIVRHVHNVNHPPSAVARPKPPSLADQDQGTT
jgi:hypothetical protein